MQIPHAEEGQICPLHKKDVSTVCHKCPWWCRIVGKNPQSEEMMDMWRCSIAILPVLLVENSQRSHQTTAAVETLRNGMVEGIMNSVNVAVQGAIVRLEYEENKQLGSSAKVIE